MTINDLLEQGISIEGNIIIKRIVSDSEEILFTGETLNKCDNHIKDNNITYMYAKNNNLYIEVE